MTRGARIFMYFSFAFINFFLLKGMPIKVLGLVFLILGIHQLVTRPQTN